MSISFQLIINRSNFSLGMNLQICFMNETASDTESPSSDSETCPKLSKSMSTSSSLNYKQQQQRQKPQHHSSSSSSAVSPGANSHCDDGRQLQISPVDSSTLSTRSSRMSLEGGSNGGWSPSPTHSNGNKSMIDVKVESMG